MRSKAAGDEGELRRKREKQSYAGELLTSSRIRLNKEKTLAAIVIGLVAIPRLLEIVIALRDCFILVVWRGSDGWRLLRP